ncbi:MAG: hypothetical protein QXD43_00900 [Candidatus Aenigmatarchaeota archaeon]
MAVWIFEDDCLSPERTIFIEYSGPDPFKACRALRGMLERIFEVEAIDLWERDFRWDTSSDPRGFYMRMYVSKGIDARTRMMIEVIMEGSQPSDPKKTGKLKISISGRLRTQYDLKSFLQKLPIYKFFVWLYHKLFYEDVKRSYIHLCNKLIDQLNYELRELLKLPLPEMVR